VGSSEVNLELQMILFASGLLAGVVLMMVTDRVVLP